MSCATLSAALSCHTGPQHNWCHVQFQDCYRDEYGNVIFTFKNCELVKVSIIIVQAGFRGYAQQPTQSIGSKKYILYRCRVRVM